MSHLQKENEVLRQKMEKQTSRQSERIIEQSFIGSNSQFGVPVPCSSSSSSKQGGVQQLQSTVHSSNLNSTSIQDYQNPFGDFRKETKSNSQEQQNINYAMAFVSQVTTSYI